MALEQTVIVEDNSSQSDSLSPFDSNRIDTLAKDAVLWSLYKPMFGECYNRISVYAAPSMEHLEHFDSKFRDYFARMNRQAETGLWICYSSYDRLQDFTYKPSLGTYIEKVNPLDFEYKSVYSDKGPSLVLLNTRQRPVKECADLTYDLPLASMLLSKGL